MDEWTIESTRWLATTDWVSSSFGRVCAVTISLEPPPLISMIRSTGVQSWPLVNNSRSRYRDACWQNFSLHHKQKSLLLLQLLVGNDNPQTEKEQIFDPPIVASRVRFIPYTSHMRIVCMRVELYGCPWIGKGNIYDFEFLAVWWGFWAHRTYILRPRLHICIYGLGTLMQAATRRHWILDLRSLEVFRRQISWFIIFLTSTRSFLPWNLWFSTK